MNKSSSVADNTMASFVRSPRFERLIMGAIIVNAVTLGMETSATIMQKWGFLVVAVDRLCLSLFVAELVLKLSLERQRFFKNAWNVFDFLVVAIALFPATGSLSVLRALRVLRTLRLISISPHLRRVVGGLLQAIPGLSSVGVIMSLIFYVGAVIATKLFGGEFPEWFGSIGKSAYTLFQVMTLESWSMGIARPVIEKFPLAWMFFVPFILIATFTMLNLFIAVIVNSLQSETDEKAQERSDQAHDERETLLAEVRALRAEIRNLTHRGEDGFTIPSMPKGPTSNDSVLTR